MNEITRIIRRVADGSAEAAGDLLSRVYDELRDMAAVRLVNERPGHTLQATALVHEAYLRLVGDEQDGAGRWANRAHFFGAAAEAMRRILVDHARARNRLKRGGAQYRRSELTPTEEAVVGIPDELIELHDSLTALEEVDELKARLVKLKFFGGLTTAEAAECLGMPVRTAERYWAFARAWLHREMAGTGQQL